MKNILIELEKEIKTAQKIVDKGLKECMKNDFNARSYQFYLQQKEYLRGLITSKNIIEKEIKKNEK